MFLSLLLLFFKEQEVREKSCGQIRASLQSIRSIKILVCLSFFSVSLQKTEKTGTKRNNRRYKDSKERGRGTKRTRGCLTDLTELTSEVTGNNKETKGPNRRTSPKRLSAEAQTCTGVPPDFLGSWGPGLRLPIGSYLCLLVSVNRCRSRGLQQTVAHILGRVQRYTQLTRKDACCINLWVRVRRGSVFFFLLFYFVRSILFHIVLLFLFLFFSFLPIFFCPLIVPSPSLSFRSFLLHTTYIDHLSRLLHLPMHTTHSTSCLPHSVMQTTTRSKSTAALYAY